MGPPLSRRAVGGRAVRPLRRRGRGVARAVAGSAGGRGIDQPTQADDGRGGHASLRRLVCDLVEEYGRHTGHADLLRESVDGLVGEDPPPDWRP
ncbi:DUF664 domain-containing protein [Nocardioides daphniae]|uniref:mycothiol transferase n=1 Tax=Nocardioides daphniae TaxID=402297 RepID=UPI0030B84793